MFNGNQSNMEVPFTWRQSQVPNYRLDTLNVVN